MKDLQRDIWAEWLLNRRFGGNADEMKATLDHLYSVRDKVLKTEVTAYIWKSPQKANQAIAIQDFLITMV